MKIKNPSSNLIVRKKNSLQHLQQAAFADLVFAFFLLFSLGNGHGMGLFAQNIGINGNGATADASAILDIDVSAFGANAKKGVLIPRVSLSSTTDVTTISTPATSLLVYNTNAGMTGGGAGYWYYGGSKWIAILNSGSTNNQSAWLLEGNAGTNSGTNFLGSTDNVSLRMRTNNIQRMVVDSIGNVGIGTMAPSKKLEVSGGDALIRNITISTSQIYVSNASLTLIGGGPQTSRSHILLTNSGGITLNAASSSAQNILLDTRSNGGYILLSSGNVGIGTNSPSSILHTVKSGAQTVTCVGNALTNTATSSTASINKTGVDIQSTGTWNGTNAVNTGLNVNVSGGTTNIAAIFQGGNVGIGTTSPTSILQVVGLLIYANNAAAVAGGLTAGAFYRTGGDPDLVCVVH